jgi:hypothetical protein
MNNVGRRFTARGMRFVLSDRLDLMTTKEDLKTQVVFVLVKYYFAMRLKTLCELTCKIHPSDYPSGAIRND